MLIDVYWTYKYITEMKWSQNIVIYSLKFIIDVKILQSN